MLKKLIFKNEVKDILLAHILKGEIKSGERISLPKTAEALGVSVTPVREALTQLSETGIVNYVANRGFFLAELSPEAARDIYELLALLESHAVKKSSFTTRQLEELRELNRAFVDAQDAIELLGHDRLFHQKLIERYPNQLAHKTIENLRVLSAIYDYAFWTEEHKMTSSVMHEKIIDSLAAGEVDKAVVIVADNWLQGVGYIIDQLEKTD